MEAYRRIVQRFQDMAYGYAYSILGDFDLAEDAAQEAFIQAYRELGSLRDVQAFANWFRRIVFTQCTRLTRGKHLSTVPIEDAIEVPAPEEPAQVVEARDMRERVMNAVGSLPEHEREACSST